MSVEHEAVLMYGVYFGEPYQVREYVTKNLATSIVRSEDFLEDLEHQIAADEIVIDGVTFEIVCLNLYTGDGFILGWNVEFGEDITPRTQAWDKIFPQASKKPKIILDVKTY